MPDPPGQVPANVMILRDSNGTQEIFEVDHAIVQNYGNSVRVIGRNETFVFDSSKVVVVKNPTEKTRQRLLDKIKK